MVIMLVIGMTAIFRFLTYFIRLVYKMTSLSTFLFAVVTPITSLPTLAFQSLATMALLTTCPNASQRGVKTCLTLRGTEWSWYVVILQSSIEE